MAMCKSRHQNLGSGIKTGIGNINSPLQLDLKSLNLAWLWRIFCDVSFGMVVTCLLSRGLLVTESCDKCKILYLHFYNTRGHQTWKSGNLGWRSPIHPVTYANAHCSPLYRNQSIDLQSKFIDWFLQHWSLIG